MTSKQLITTLVVLIALGIIFTLGRMLITPAAVVTPSPTPIVSNVACTMDAKMCPDGSSVGRQGPNCEFAMCPGTVTTASSTTNFKATLGEKTGAFDILVTPIEVLEDSRCPVNVQCIQAGTVRLKAEVSGNGTTTQQVFTMGKAITTNGRTLTLTQVFPTKTAGVTVSPSDYNFYFDVKK